MIFNFLKYLIGFVKFRASEGFCDKFINLCKNMNIPLWNIENKNGEITACTTVNGYFRIKSVSKQSGMKIRIIKKIGLRFFITKNKVRSGLCIGATAFMLILITLSQFVWRIEVVGNAEIEDETVISAFEEYGIKIGAKISDLDLKSITEKAIINLPDVSWAKVNKKGSLLCIEIREKRKAPELYSAGAPTNVVASEDGVILSSDVLQGTEEVKVGSAVRKGDLLISGIVTHRDGTEELLHADGFVRARIKDNYNISRENLTVYALKSYKKCSDIFFFGFEIPVGIRVSGDIVSKNGSYLQSGEVILPVGIVKTTGLAFSEDKPSDEILDLICVFKCCEHIKYLTDTAEIKNSKVTVTDSKNNFSLNVYSICEKDIAELKEIYFEKNKDKE